MSDWIDISIPLRTGMVHWPGDPPVSLELVSSIDAGDAANVTQIAMSAHTGTHMDAPLHFLPDGRAIDAMPFEAVIGRARVIEIQDKQCIRGEEISAHAIQPEERLLFKTINSQRCWTSGDFLKQFVHLNAEAASYLADRRIRTVGVDYLSVGAYGADGDETHRLLLRAGIWIIEGLDLSGVEVGQYELVCLPLRIADGDGAPARAIVRRII